MQTRNSRVGDGGDEAEESILRPLWSTSRSKSSTGGSKVRVLFFGRRLAVQMGPWRDEGR